MAAVVQTILAQPDKAPAQTQPAFVAGNSAGRFPKAAELLIEAEEGVLAYMHFLLSIVVNCTRPIPWNASTV